jgi:hypothetical protein
MKTQFFSKLQTSERHRMGTFVDHTPARIASARKVADLGCLRSHDFR